MRTNLKLRDILLILGAILTLVVLLGSCIQVAPTIKPLPVPYLSEGRFEGRVQSPGRRYWVTGVGLQLGPGGEVCTNRMLVKLVSDNGVKCERSFTLEELSAGYKKAVRTNYVVRFGNGESPGKANRLIDLGMADGNAVRVELTCPYPCATNLSVFVLFARVEYAGGW